MDIRVDRIEGRVMAVNSYVVHGPEGLVVVDGMLTVSDAALVRDAVARTGERVAGVLITHPHPDHYAGVAHVVGSDDVPIVATPAVDAVIRRDDALKDAVVGPMMGDEWPAERRFPDFLVETGHTVRLGGVDFTVEELGPGESDVDTVWWLDGDTAFVGDLVSNRMHAYLADGRWQDWLASLEAFEARVGDGATLHVGHGAPGTKALISAQRRYIDAFVAAMATHADAVEAGDHEPVLAAMREVVPGEDLLFLLDLSIDPVLGFMKAGDLTSHGKE